MSALLEMIPVQDTPAKTTERGSTQIALEIVKGYVKRCLSEENQYSEPVLGFLHWQANILPLRKDLGAQWDRIVAPLLQSSDFAMLALVTPEMTCDDFQWILLTCERMAPEDVLQLAPRFAMQTFVRKKITSVVNCLHLSTTASSAQPF